MSESDSSADTTSEDTESDARAEDRTDEDRASEAEHADEDEARDSDPDDHSLGAGVVTIAADRTLESDAAGEAIVTVLETEGHEVAVREHVGSDHDRVQSIVSRLIDRDDVDFIVTAGATSVEPDDVTIEAVEPLLDKHLPAFTELFTTLAYETVGTRVVAARTLAGVADGVPVFCLPGNETAVRLGLGEIALPEAHHLVELARVPDETDDGADEDEAAADGETDDENGGG